jgi:Family of unknown function (DUF6599)
VIEQTGRKDYGSGKLFPRVALWTVFLGCICLGLIFKSSLEAVEAKQGKDIRALFPSQDIRYAWRPVGEPQVYEGRELYEYINGGADLYLEYGFEEAAGLEYQGPDNAVIIIDIYRMSSAAAAYGIFSAGRRMDHTSLALGTVASQTPYQLTFCKGEFFVKVQSLEAGEEDNLAAEYLAGEIDSRIFRADTTVPGLAQRLPRDYLLPQSVTLALGPLGLNSCRYLGDENFFELGGDTWGALGLYRFPGNERRPSVLLFAEYQDNAAAGKIDKKLTSNIKRSVNVTSGGLVEFPVLWRVEGNRLAAWFGLPGERQDLAKELLNEVLK